MARKLREHRVFPVPTRGHLSNQELTRICQQHYGEGWTWCDSQADCVGPEREVVKTSFKEGSAMSGFPVKIWEVTEKNE